MSLSQLRSLLEHEQVHYSLIRHAPTYTAQETATLMRIPPREMAKSVMVSLDGRLAMVVVPASRRVSPALLREVSGACVVRVLSEDDFRAAFPDCELGAMPPFGNLYNLAVYVAEELTAAEWVAFRAGRHTELMWMRYEDFARLVRPVVARLGERG